MRTRGAMLAVVIAGAVLVGAAAALIPAVSSGQSKSGTAPEIVAYVNGEPIERGEWQLVYRKYRNKEQTLDALVRVKTIQQEAVRHGLLESAAYSAFLDELERENRRRQTALDRGEWIAGPQRFSAVNYYDNRQADLENRLTELMVRTRFDISDHALENYFADNMDRFARKHDIIKLLKVTVPIQSDDLDGYGEARQTALDRAEALRGQLLEGAEPQMLDAGRTESAGTVQTEVIDETNYRDLSKYRNDFYHAALHLEPGEISPVLEDQGMLVAIRSLSREAGGYRTLEEVREEVRQRYIDHLFDAHIGALVHAAKIERLPLYGDFQ
jgi:hypothetical protein